MSRLIINKLVYTVVTTEDVRYGATIPFKNGLNIIFGPNSVGKTSIVTGIIYGLGAEKGLGIFKTIQNPFKPEFYNKIDNKTVKISYLLLEISNGTETRTIFRYIKGKKDNDVDLVAVKKCFADDFFETTEEATRLIISGEGVFSEKGFQNFLFDFIGIKQVELPTYDNKLSKLYFENILPLFFVEQRAGWSQIQARQVSRYNIKDIKKVAFEFLIGLDRFNLHLSQIKVKELEAKLKKYKDELNQKEENLLIIANGEKKDEIPIINTNVIGKTSIYDYINYLNVKYQIESEFINQLSSENKEFEKSNEKLRDSLKALDYQYRKASEKVEKLTIEILGYENYLERIKANKYKNKQLKKIREVSTELNITTCPVCEAKLETETDRECVLCHSDLHNKISTPEQNLAFLEDEENTFKKVISQRILDRGKILEQRNGLKDKIKEYESQLEHQTKTFVGNEFAALRKRILDADSIHKEMEKYLRISQRWVDLKPLRSDITLIAVELEQIKSEVKKYEQTKSDQDIIDTLKTYFHSNVYSLGLFKGNKSLIQSIKLDSNDNYTPYLDRYDIYNISSSSDNIRIILSYYLALLQTSIKFKNLKSVGFPKLLILDEPKQQNLDNDSLIDSISVIESISPNESQVILTTYSELPSDKERLKKHIIYEMKNKTDYLLKKIEN